MDFSFNDIEEAKEFISFWFDAEIKTGKKPVSGLDKTFSFLARVHEAEQENLRNFIVKHHQLFLLNVSGPRLNNDILQFQIAMKPGRR